MTTPYPPCPRSLAYRCTICPRCGRSTRHSGTSSYSSKVLPLFRRHSPSSCCRWRGKSNPQRCSPRGADIRCRRSTGSGETVGRPYLRSCPLLRASPCRRLRGASRCKIRAPCSAARMHLRLQQPAFQLRHELAAPCHCGDCRRRTIFGSVPETHSHPSNIECIARTQADANCVDCISFAFFRQHCPQLGLLTRVLAVTPPSPSIPFVTSAASAPSAAASLRMAVFGVARAPQWQEV
jgi:hypothetical protein